MREGLAVVISNIPSIVFAGLAFVSAYTKLDWKLTVAFLILSLACIHTVKS
jgi:hypothetical protein